jgi:hypothetical protein
VVKVRLHSAGDASPLTALLLPQIFPIIPDILGRRALSAWRLAALGATPDFHHGSPPLPEPANVLYRIKRGLSGYVSNLAACEMNESLSEYVL